MSKTILCVVGTRPEAIKMAPLILALRAEPWARVRVLATAQHRALLDQILAGFGIAADIDLDVMRPNQALGALTARLLRGLGDVLDAERPDLVLVQGDTTTALSAALACFYQHIPLGHVEAGLRTGDLRNPFPEEANRVLAARLASWHFAPTAGARDNLLREGVEAARIVLSGNTVIDALLMTAAGGAELGLGLDPARRLVLVTSHRRENFGAPLHEICRGLRALAQRNADVQFLYPVHPNPNVREVVQQWLADLPNFMLSEPLDYTTFVAAMRAAHLLLTDSGGVQEEAPALGKPVLVLRDETERPEAVAEGVVKLVGPHAQRIVEHTQRLLDDAQAWRAMARGVSPYGDGHAAERIVHALRRSFAPCA